MWDKVISLQTCVIERSNLCKYFSDDLDCTELIDKFLNLSSQRSVCAPLQCDEPRFEPDFISLLLEKVSSFCHREFTRVNLPVIRRSVVADFNVVSGGLDSSRPITYNLAGCDCAGAKRILEVAQDLKARV
jgi:hypothetical protein